MNIEISASAVAWYGAIVATLSAIASGYGMFRDRARLIIKVAANMEMFPKGINGNENQVLVTIANAGRRPVTITHVWFERGKGQNLLLLRTSFQPGGTELKEGKFVNFNCIQSSLDSAIKTICVQDATGKKHRKKLLPDFIRAIASEKKV